MAATTAHSATFVVDRYDDDNGSCTVGDCSLREALLAAEATPETDTVVLPEGRHLLSIPETTPPSLLGGDLEILDFDVDITAPEGATVDAQGNDRVFRFVNSTSRIENLEITGGFMPDDLGGGIYVDSSDIELSNLWVHDNEAGIGGGIAFLFGRVLLSDSAITDNESLNHAGGIYQFGINIFTSPARLEVRNSTISGNLARTAGGAIVALGASILIMEYSTVANNTNRSGDRTMFGFLGNAVPMHSIYLLREPVQPEQKRAACFSWTRPTRFRFPISDWSRSPSTEAFHQPIGFRHRVLHWTLSPLAPHVRPVTKEVS